jgi:hypothetical protein
MTTARNSASCRRLSACRFLLACIYPGRRRSTGLPWAKSSQAFGLKKSVAAKLDGCSPHQTPVQKKSTALTLDGSGTHQGPVLHPVAPQLDGSRSQSFGLKKSTPPNGSCSHRVTVQEKSVASPFDGSHSDQAAVLHPAAPRLDGFRTHRVPVLRPEGVRFLSPGQGRTRPPSWVTPRRKEVGSLKGCDRRTAPWVGPSRRPSGTREEASKA